MLKHTASLLCVLSCLMTGYSQAETMDCNVIGISDGDTVTCLKEKQQYKIRLAEIDAPEKNQDFGTTSRQNLSDLVYRKNVTIQYDQKDRYGRIIGYITVGGKDVNKEQLSKGMAWFYTDYGKRRDYKEVSAIAKSNKIGLWQKPNPIEPWNFRKGERTVSENNARKPTVPLASNDNTMDCDKKTCGQISSCAEAKHLLNDCGYGVLDRDKDGIPCETLCR